MQATASVTAATQAIQQDPALSSEACSLARTCLLAWCLCLGCAHFQGKHKVSAESSLQCPLLSAAADPQALGQALASVSACPAFA